MRSATNSRSGSAVLAALIVGVLVSGLAATYLRTAYQDYRYSRELLMAFQALNLAEAGVENAIYSYNTGNWNGWNLESTGNYSRTFHIAHNRKVQVITDPSARPIVIFAEGLVDNTATPQISRQIIVELNKRGLFANGLTSKSGIVLNGSKISVDSYSSSKGSYHSTLNRGDKATIASTSIVSGIVEINNAEIWGYVATGGGEPDIGPNGSIRGEDTEAGVDVDSDRVSYDFYADFPEITAPSMDGAQTTFSGGSIGSPGNTSRYNLSSLNIGNGSTVTVYGDVTIVVDGETDIKGELIIDPDSSVEIYIKDDMNVGGNGIVNEGSEPSSLQIYAVGNNVGEVKMHGAGTLYGVIYAPDSNVDLKGGGSVASVFGAIVADRITMNGNYSFHYDEDLADLGESGFSVSVWQELVAASDKKNYAALREDGL